MSKLPDAQVVGDARFNPGKLGRGTLKYVLVAGLMVLVLFPLSWALLGSFKQAGELFVYPPSFWPRSFTPDNYLAVLTRTELPNYLKNTTIVTVFSVLFTLAFGAVAAYGFSRWNFRFKNAVMIVILMFQLIPGTVNVIPYYVMLNSLDLLNTHAGLILIYTATHVPFTIWILKGYFDTIPTSLDEAAIIDGCSRFRVFWNIILPLSLPGLGAAGFLAFLASWGEFLIPLVVANTRDVMVLSVGLYYSYGNETFGTIPYNELFAASVVATLPVLIAYIFAQEHFVSGLTSGSEK